MSQTFNKWIWTATGVLLLGVCMPFVASAATINIILSDVDVIYAGDQGVGGAIYDITAYNGGDQDTTESDVVETAVFELDMNQVATEMTGGGTTLYADLKIDGIGASSPKGSLNNVGANGGGFGFEYFTSDGQFLKLGIDNIDLLITNNTMFFTGTASVLSQNLPPNLTFKAGEPVAFSYTAVLPGLVGNPSVTMAVTSGALVIAGEAIPEPTTMATLLVGLALSAAGATVRRRAA
ncbi:MAG: hypothetical protein WD971_09700 [Pirellulales bacterium]